MMKIQIVFLFTCIALFGMPAITKTRIVTQPNGEKIVLHLKGDASFHWLESGGDIVVYNPKDGYYYKAKIDPVQGILPTRQKVHPTLQRQTPHLSPSQKKAIERLIHKIKKQHNHPR